MLLKDTEGCSEHFFKIKDGTSEELLGGSGYNKMPEHLAMQQLHVPDLVTVFCGLGLQLASWISAGYALSLHEGHQVLTLLH